MTEKKPRIPSYCHHRASGKAVVRIEGQDHYLGPYGSIESRKRYDQLVGEWLTRKRAGVIYAGQETREDLTVNELLAAYLQHAQGYFGISVPIPAGSAKVSWMGRSCGV